MSSKSDFNKTAGRKQAQKAQEAVKQALAKPSPSALIYGYLKEKDVNLKDMSVESWKAIEKDVVDILLSEVYPGEDISEDQLNFTSLMQSFAFMSNFIEVLNSNLEKQKPDGNGSAADSSESKPAEQPKTKFEV